ncbi:MAG: thioredoxin family protein, partial [Dehalococcoidia bacterium]|nr:thioredoxin family protein [Dehalococcoidia bacterium]
AALAERVPDLRIDRHDAVAATELAKEYGVLSVPTTAVYDRSGALVTINRGFTPAAVLLAQVEGRTPDLEGGAAMSSEVVA